MTLVKWNKPNNGVKRNNEFFPAFGTFPSLLEDIFTNDPFFKRDFASYVPAVNIAEAADSFSIELSAPGFSKEDFKVEVENDVLTISGEQKNEKSEEGKTYTRKEFSFGSFKRAFSLPKTVDTDKIEAKYENGILTIIVSKREEAKSKPAREISIS
jgi:HSP20 family protein